MFCSKCGTDNSDNANFCIKCGNALNFFTPQDLQNSNPSSQKTLDPKIAALLSENDTCTSLMILGLIFSIFNFIPYLNVFTSIVSIVLVIIGMNKVIKFASNFTSINGEGYKIEQQVRKLRFHYILSIVISIVLVCIIVSSIITLSYAAAYRSESANVSTISILTFLFVVFIVYNMAIQIWALVRWFSVKEFLSVAKMQLNSHK